MKMKAEDILQSAFLPAGLAPLKLCEGEQEGKNQAAGITRFGVVFFDE